MGKRTLFWDDPYTGGENGGPMLDRARQAAAPALQPQDGWPALDEDTGLWCRPGCWECY